MNFNMENNIDWDDLKQKVDADLEEELKQEQEAIKEELKILQNIVDEYPGRGIVNLDYTPKEEEDYFDEGGELEDGFVQELTWNKYPQPTERHNIFSECDCNLCNEEDEEDEEDEDDDEYDEEDDDEYNCGPPKKYSLECKHIQKDDYENIYIYPIDDEQELCLCTQCNMILASKMLEQLALETFL